MTSVMVSETAMGLPQRVFVCWLESPTIGVMPARPISVAAVLLMATPVMADQLHFTWLWHLEQPIYWPDQQHWGEDRIERAWESIQRTDGGDPHPENDLRSIFGLDDRVAAYQYRTRDAISGISWLPEAGAQISYSGGLIENLESFADAGGQLGYSTDFSGSIREARSWSTSGGGAPRCDVVQFAFHHPLLPLLDDAAVRMELALYAEIYGRVWGDWMPQSRGFFPSEMAFSTRLIPALRDAGIEWSFVSGEKLSRACANFPVQLGSGGINCDPPNLADQLNPAQENYNRVTISRGCSPAEAAPFAYTPQRAMYVDPESGDVDTLVVVPCSQSLGWEDGYAPLGVDRLNAVASFNAGGRPMLVVLGHDGDNAWGGGFSYYNEAVPGIAGAANSAGHVPTVVQRYLDDHPVPASDRIHVEDGAWVNADGDFGAPQMLNWNWPPVNSSGQIDIENGWAEDVRNWAVITAAQNAVLTAEHVSTGAGQPVRVSHVLDPRGSTRSAERAWHYFLGSLNSGYMYYGTVLDMEVKPTIACNEAIEHAEAVLTGGWNDDTPPTIWIPQRWPWNPGSLNYGAPYGYQSSIDDGDFHVWTFVHDVSGCEAVTLHVREDLDGTNPLASIQNETYAGGGEVAAWTSIAMTQRDFPAGDVLGDGGIDFFEMPEAIADQYYVELVGYREVLLDYYIEAIDSHGNVRRSPIQHVWVGDGSGSGGAGGGVETIPDPPVAGEPVIIQFDASSGPLAGAEDVFIHVGFNGWQDIVDPDPAMSWNESDDVWEVSIDVPADAEMLDCVFNDGLGTWDNNNGADWHIGVDGGEPLWSMDGELDDGAALVATGGGRSLYAGLASGRLYVATEAAGGGDDVFLLLAAESAGQMQPAMWGKAGEVAAWDAFLAHENDNGWLGWFNADQSGEPAGAHSAAGGSVLEGWIDLGDLLGAAPGAVALAAVPYGTDDAGPLSNCCQAPASTDGDGDVQSIEYVIVDVCDLDSTGCCPGDADGDGHVGVDDALAVLAAWGQPGGSGDVDGDGIVGVDDLLLIISHWGGCDGP